MTADGNSFCWTNWLAILLAGAVMAGTACEAAAQGQPDPKPQPDKTSAARLKAVREIMQEIKMISAANGELQPLDLKPDPLLRYNDVTRGILDSVVFRVGTKGRPVALISAELYGRQGTRFLLNHEFVALYEPKFQMQRDTFIWEPRQGNLTFQEIPDAEAPADNSRLRLAQMRRLAEKFKVTEVFGTSKIVLRLLATPLDRYQPTDDPRTDGSLFAFVSGVNPEAILFVESDGQKWTNAWARLGAAPLISQLGDVTVWEQPLASEHETRTAPYTSIYRQLVVPPDFDSENVEPEPRP